MRRTWLAFIVWMSVSSAVALTSGLALARDDARDPASGAPQAQMLFGDQTVEPSLAAAVPGRAEAFSFGNRQPGTAWMITFFVDSRTRATGLIAGLYSERTGRPATLLATGHRAALKPGRWNSVSIPRLSVRAGSTYWVGILAKGGSLYLRNARDAGCPTRSISRRNMRFMPASWTGAQRSGVCRISAYVSGVHTDAVLPSPAPALPSPSPSPAPVPTTPPALPAISAPGNSSAPVVTGNTLVGKTLTTTPGSWTGSPVAYSFQWEDCDGLGNNCSSIFAAVSSSYTLSSTDVGHSIRAVVTAVNLGGATSASSAATVVVTTGSAPPAAPVSTAAPVVSGTAQQGQTLTTSNGSWSGSPTGYGYQWQDCNSSGGGCVNVGGATSRSYVLGSGDVGHTVRSVVTATNAGGSASASSAVTAVVTASAPPAAPVSTAAPVVSGTAQQGQTLTTSNGSWSGSPTGYAYQWQDCDTSGVSCGNITGATASSYVLASGDVGHTIRSVVTATNAGGSGSASSAATGTVTSGSGGGSTGCFASPGACGYPDPTAGNVGATAPCSSLSASGSITASTAGQTIQNLNVTGTITVNAANVTINNVCVTDNAGGQIGSRAILLNSGGKNALIEHVTVAGANQSTQSVEQAIANNSSSTATVTSAHLYNCGECLWNGPWTVSDSYVITNGMQGTGDHLEGLYMSDSTATLNHDVLLDPDHQNSAVFGDANWGSGGPCANHWTITNSLLAGGGFVIYTCGNASSVGSSTMNISNNRFARCTTAPIKYNSSTGGSACQGSTGSSIGSGADSHGYWPYGGYFGLDAWTYCTGTNQTWTGNVWDDNATTVPCS